MSLEAALNNAALEKHAKKLLLDDNGALYLRDAILGHGSGNTVIGGVLSLTLGVPRQVAEQAVDKAVEEIWEKGE